MPSISLTSLDFLRQPDWWRQAASLIIGVLPKFVWPACSLALANILLFWGVEYSNEILHQAELTMDMLIQACTVVLLSCLVGLLLSLWSLSMWLFRLTAWCRLCLEDLDSVNTAVAAKFGQCLKEISSRKWQLSRIWLIASLYLLIPVVLLIIILVALTLLNSEISRGVFTPPPAVNNTLIIASLLLTIAVTGYTLVLMVIAATGKLAAGDSNVRCLQLSWQYKQPLLLLAAMVVLVNVAVSTPQVLWGHPITSVNLSRESLPWLIAQQLWLATTSAILWPWSLLTFCQLLKSEIQS